MTKSPRSGQWANAPLIYALAQVVISPVLKMGDHVPEIQDKLRKVGFPKFKETVAQEIQFDPSAGQPPAKKRWGFFNRDNTQAISLTDNFLVLHVSDYTNFEDFAEVLEVGLNVLKEVAAPELSERLGLRYVDLVRLKEGEGFGKYLKPGLLGFHVEGASEMDTLTRCETVMDTEYGKLVSCSTRYNDGTFLPPGIGAEELEFEEIRRPPEGEMVNVLDFDHFSLETRDFIVDDILNCFAKMHEYTGAAFKEAITDFALKTWNPANNKKGKAS